MATKTKKPKTEIVRVEFHGECLMPNGFDRKATARRIARKLFALKKESPVLTGYDAYISDVFLGYFGKDEIAKLRAAVAKIIEKELEG